MSEQVYIDGNTYILGATINRIPGTGGYTSYSFNMGSFTGGETYNFIVVAYNDAGFSGYDGPISLYKSPPEQRFPIYALAFSWPHDWVSGGKVFTQSTGNKNLLAYSNNLSISGTNYPTDDNNTGTAGCWEKRNIASIETGFDDPVGSKKAFKITLSNIPGDYSQFYQIQEEIKPNTTYTYSFWIETSLTNVNNFTYGIFNTTVKSGDGYVFIDGGPISNVQNNGWVKTTKTFTTGATQYGVAIYALNSNNSNGSVAYMWGNQLEEGQNATSFEVTSGFKEFNSGIFNQTTGQRVYSPNFNLWLNYASNIGASYISPMIKPPFGRNNSRKLTTFIDGWTSSYVLKLCAQQLAALPEGLKVISAHNFDYGQMLYHENDKINVSGLTGFKFVNDNLIYGRQDGYFYGSWNDAGITLYKNYWSKMLDAIYAYGGSIDQVHQDNEDNPSLMWSMDLRLSGENKTNAALAYANDSRYNQSWRGMTSWQNLMYNYGATVGKIFDYNDGTGITSYTIWNYISSKYTGKVFDEIFYQTTKTKNANVLVSNYNYFTTDAATKTNLIGDAPPDPSGHPQFLDVTVGNASAPYLYGEMGAGLGGSGPDISWKIRSEDPTRLYKSFLPGQKLSDINPSRWSRFLLTLQTIRSIKRANPQNIITPWISSENYPQGYIQDIAGAEPEDNQDKINFYYEAIRHMSVSGIKHFLWWNDFSIFRGQFGQIIRQSDFNKMSDVLREVNSRIGGSTPTAMVTERISWFAEYLISGAPSAFGGYWWRVTPKPGYVITVNEHVIDAERDIGEWIYTTTSTIPVCSDVTQK